jgi:hypothetical protein
VSTQPPFVTPTPIKLSFPELIIVILVTKEDILMELHVKLLAHVVNSLMMKTINVKIVITAVNVVMDQLTTIVSHVMKVHSYTTENVLNLVQPVLMKKTDLVNHVLEIA